MRPITKDVLKFLIGFSMVLIVSALLAPWLHTFLPFKFDRILRRLIMIGSLALVYGLVRSRRQNLVSLGLAWEKRSLPLLGKGYLIGILLVMVLTLLQWKLGVRFWRLSDKDTWHWIGFYLKGIGAGLLIGTIEELFFRAFLFMTFSELWNKGVSLVVTNLVYAVVHFFPKGKVFVDQTPTLHDSFRIFHAAVTPSPEVLHQILPAMAGLFLFGLILSFLYLRSGSLYLSMGVHAGAILGLKINHRYFPEIADKFTLMSGTKNLYDGITGLTVLLLATLMAGWWSSRQKASL